MTAYAFDTADRAIIVATQGGLESTPPERDLSVQLGGWMVLELAAALDREGCPRPSLG